MVAAVAASAATFSNIRPNVLNNLTLLSKQRLQIDTLGIPGAALSQIGAATGITPRPVLLVSFENDLDSLRLALTHVSSFAHLQHAGPHQLVKHGEWQSKTAPLRWQLGLTPMPAESPALATLCRFMRKRSSS